MRCQLVGSNWMVTATLLGGIGLSSAFAFLPFPSRVPGFRYPLQLSPSSMAEKVLEAPKWPPEWPYSEVDFARMDESDDTIFYDSPRLVSSDNIKASSHLFPRLLTILYRSTILTTPLCPH